ncbi:MAG: peptidoglycan editing factor PgeF [Rhodospirillales bacterium]|nr:peptidoglycan editing factor PgeF [Rhodospirillales bacterium]
MTIPRRSGLIQPDWPAPARVRAASTLRGGGVSRGSYASLNLSAGVGDDEANVARNRRIFSEMLELPAEPLWLGQVHGIRILDLDSGDPATANDLAGQLSPGPSNSTQPPTADGAVTSRGGQPCAVLTADCLPVLLCDTSGSRVGAAHAGWRGLAGGVLESAVRCMDVDPGRLLAWIGPGIGPAAYEVGNDVLERFTASDPDAARCFTSNSNGRWQADLYGLARRRLRAAGVPAVHGGSWCAHTESNRFFSHRREAPCGRMATVIWLD